VDEICKGVLYLIHHNNILGELPVVAALVKDVIPAVDVELGNYRELLRSCPDHRLVGLAEASLTHKRFHALGGSVFALNSHPDYRDTVLRLIVAFQTISDYLDNLCDRAGVLDEATFRQLHLSMEDAVCVRGVCHDYYKYYPYSDDGGYLNQLVEVCCHETAHLPGYDRIRQTVLYLTQLYCDLQAHKHKEPSNRESSLIEWTRPHLDKYPELNWWEFAAATGSTLCTFSLFAAASYREVKQKELDAILKAYFPWICSLHILLDYLIDMEEDRREGDLNFVGYYKEPSIQAERLGFILGRSKLLAPGLSNPSFHLAVINGLLGLYLSDPKVEQKMVRGTASALIKAGGYKARVLQKGCTMLRQAKVI